MRVRRRISHLLMLIILCMLIFYAGIYLQIDVPGESVPLKLNQMLIEISGKKYLSGLFYPEEDENLRTGQWIATQAMRLLPLGEYINNMQKTNIQTEDKGTYELILAMQASDENEVDENGKLIEENRNDVKKAMTSNISQEKLKDFEYLISNFYTVDSSTSVSEKLLDVEKLLDRNLKIDKTTEGPKILIYHTHSQEAFKDSKKGKTSDTIMGMGEYLTKLLNEEYGIKTMHHKGVYDLIDGKLDRSKAYQLAESDVRQIIKDNPSIEVVIDLHRDGVGESTHLVTEINGKQTAQIMFFNGMSRTRANGDIEYLYNPYIQDNLAFSLQMQLCATERYPGFARRIYLKSYRYNMHLMPKTLLIEAGAQTNTVSEMQNAMVVLAEILHNVLV